MKEITLTISPEGEPKLETSGFSGSACSLFSKKIEEALGSTSSDLKKPEFYQGGKTHVYNQG